MNSNEEKAEKIIRRPFILDVSDTRLKEISVVYEKADDILFKKHEKKKKKYFK